MHAQSARRAALDRAGSNDLLQRHYTPRPAEAHVGALLVLDSERPLDLAALRDAFADPIRAVPRLRRRLLATPPGCGRPVWVDDPDFDVDRHVSAIGCPAPGDERAVLDVVASFVSARLPADRPPWAAALVHGLAGGRTGLVLVFDHVLADGIGGLAVLAHLADGRPSPAAGPFPQPPPTRRQLAADATRSRVRTVLRAPMTLGRLAAAVAQLRPGLVRAPPTALNRPTGPRRRLAVAHADLAALRAAGHAYGGTVNDVFLAAVTGGLHAFLRARGELHDRFVVSVPVSAHRVDEQDPVRNRTGVVPVSLPAAGDPFDRLRETARCTRGVKSGARGATAVLLEPFFAALGRLRLVRWYVNHQRRVNAFTTNLRGPAQRLRVLDAPVTDLLPVNAVAGNVGVAFGALSYAGTLAVTVVADPDVCPDVHDLAVEVRRQLDAYAVGAPPVASAARHPVSRSMRTTITGPCGAFSRYWG